MRSGGDRSEPNPRLLFIQESFTDPAFLGFLALMIMIGLAVSFQCVVVAFLTVALGLASIYVGWSTFDKLESMSDTGIRMIYSISREEAEERAESWREFFYTSAFLIFAFGFVLCVAFRL